VSDATTVQMIGAGLFGAVLGLQVYAINRYRTGEVKLSDLVTLIGAIGGAAILAVFPAHSDLFGPTVSDSLSASFRTLRPLGS
jgi:hypothetical protein